MVTKVDIAPVVPTKITHHRELPYGSYKLVLSGFRESCCVVRRLQDGALYLVDWQGKGKMLSQFDLHADGSIEYDDPNDRCDPLQ
jgi:hypothetical protein